MSTVRIVRFSNDGQREEFLFNFADILLSWWDKEDKDSHIYFTVHSFAAPPTRSNDGEWGDWCPYCQEYHEFFFEPKTELHRCRVCRISHHDYYVKNYNYRFADMMGEIDHGDS